MNNLRKNTEVLIHGNSTHFPLKQQLRSQILCVKISEQKSESINVRTDLEKDNCFEPRNHKKCQKFLQIASVDSEKRKIMGRDICQQRQHKGLPNY